MSNPNEKDRAEFEGHAAYGRHWLSEHGGLTDADRGAPDDAALTATEQLARISNDMASHCVRLERELLQLRQRVISMRAYDENSSREYMPLRRLKAECYAALQRQLPSPDPGTDPDYPA